MSDAGKYANELQAAADKPVRLIQLSATKDFLRPSKEFINELDVSVSTVCEAAKTNEKNPAVTDNAVKNLSHQETFRIPSGGDMKSTGAAPAK